MGTLAKGVYLALLIAGMTGNGRDREYDIVLISAKDGSIIRNLTSGFDQSMGFEYLATPGGRNPKVRSFVAIIAIGGILFATLGRMPTLMIGAIVAAASNLLYADLAAGAPDQRLRTADARAVLPAQVDRATALHQAAQVGAMVAALASGDYELLGRAIDGVRRPDVEAVAA